MNTNSVAHYINVMQDSSIGNAVNNTYCQRNDSKMNCLKQTRSVADGLASHYAKFDTVLSQYTIELSDLADFDRHALAASIMAEDDSRASEATGPDNPAYDKKMLPALLRFMKNTTDRDEEIEFVKEWRDGIADYFSNSMQELLDEQVYNMNSDHGLLYSEDPGCPRDAGQETSIWT